MDLNFSLDLDTQEIYIIVDNSTYVSVIRDEDTYHYTNFKKLGDEDIQEKIKQVCAILFTLDEC